MGYDTKFKGYFEVIPPMGVEDVEWLRSFKEQRHDDVNMPGFWCQWVNVEERDSITGRWEGNPSKIGWDEGEKFYNYVEWLEYLIENFFGPKGYVLNGTVKWQGEDVDDRGKIIVRDNIVETINLE